MAEQWRLCRRRSELEGGLERQRRENHRIDIGAAESHREILYLTLVWRVDRVETVHVQKRQKLGQTVLDLPGYLDTINIRPIQSLSSPSLFTASLSSHTSPSLFLPLPLFLSPTHPTITSTLRRQAPSSHFISPFDHPPSLPSLQAALHLLPTQRRPHMSPLSSPAPPVGPPGLPAFSISAHLTRSLPFLRILPVLSVSCSMAPPLGCFTRPYVHQVFLPHKVP